MINYLGEARPDRYCRISSFLSLAKPCGLEEAGREGHWWSLWWKKMKMRPISDAGIDGIYDVDGTAGANNDNNWFKSFWSPSKVARWCARGWQWGTRPGRGGGTHTRRHRSPSFVIIIFLMLVNLKQTCETTIIPKVCALARSRLSLSWKWAQFRIYNWMRTLFLEPKQIVTLGNTSFSLELSRLADAFIEPVWTRW